MPNIISRLMLPLLIAVCFSWGPACMDQLTKLNDSLGKDFLSKKMIIHASYHDETSGYLKYARWDSGSWSTELIASTLDVGHYNSLAVDSKGKVHIVFSQFGPPHCIKYATNAPGYWHIEELDSSLDVYLMNSIAIGPGDVLHVCYRKRINDMVNGLHFRLTYAINNSGGWEKNDIDSRASDIGWYPSLAVNNQNLVGISYKGWTSSHALQYITNVTGSWIVTTPDTTTSYGYYSSLAFDQNGKAHISYQQIAQSTLRYRTNKSGSWLGDDTVVLNNAHTSSISVDASGSPHICYFDASLGDLVHIAKTSGSWSAGETIDSNNGGSYSSFAFDEDYNMHIVYRSNTGQDFNYATNAPAKTAWTLSAVDTAASVGGFMSLKVYYEYVFTD